MFSFRKVYLLTFCVRMVLHEYYALAVAQAVNQCFCMLYAIIGVCD